MLPCMDDDSPEVSAHLLHGAHCRERKVRKNLGTLEDWIEASQIDTLVEIKYEIDSEHKILTEKLRML